MTAICRKHCSAIAPRAFPLVAGAVLLVAVSCAGGQDLSAVPAFKQTDSMEARVQGCVTCHGQQGQGTRNGYFPRIAGKPAGYLYNQLAAFKNGTRTYAPMNYLVAYLPDAYLREMAQYFAALRPAFSAPAPSPSAPEVLLARGQALATQGDTGRGVPACVACHGKGLTGMEPGIPGLAGLSETYLVSQLTRWRVGERHAAAPDCMKRVATRMADTDITAVAAWLARQQVPAEAAPEPSNLIRMPLACGSQR